LVTLPVILRMRTVVALEGAARRPAASAVSATSSARRTSDPITSVVASDSLLNYVVELPPRPPRRETICIASGENARAAAIRPRGARKWLRARRMSSRRSASAG
jgi:hypothetical protein